MYSFQNKDSCQVIEIRIYAGVKQALYHVVWKGLEKQKMESIFDRTYYLIFSRKTVCFN